MNSYGCDITAPTILCREPCELHPCFSFRVTIFPIELETIWQFWDTRWGGLLGLHFLSRPPQQQLITSMSIAWLKNRKSGKGSETMRHDIVPPQACKGCRHETEVEERSCDAAEQCRHPTVSLTSALLARDLPNVNTILFIITRSYNDNHTED